MVLNIHLHFILQAQLVGPGFQQYNTGSTVAILFTQTIEAISMKNTNKRCAV